VRFFDDISGGKAFGDIFEESCRELNARANRRVGIDIRLLY